MNSWMLGGALVLVPAFVAAAACGGGNSQGGSGASTSASSSGQSSTGTTSSSSGGGGSSSSSGSTSGSTSSGTGTSSSSGTCAAVDPNNDMKPCGSGCPAGQTCFGPGSGVCVLSCDPNDQATCPCDRYCGGLVGPDGGPAGGACFPANTAGERCDQIPGPDGGLVNFDKGGCAQALLCGRSAGSMKDYCIPLCATQADCPAHTNCVQFLDSMMKPVAKACAYDTGPGGLALGATCAATDSCIADTLCDGTCKTQCDGPGGVCATGTCTAVLEGTKTLGYVCK